ncbi:MAG: leucyl/phenylalanyl-tRNA--protein transferase [Acidimicrobiales bacterium]
MPVEPPPSRWLLPDPRISSDDVVAVGADLEPSTLIAAYKQGLFPMPLESGKASVMGWWSPDPRGILPLENLRVTRSLRQSVRRHRVTVNRAFPDVIEACSDRGRSHGWITDDIRAAYTHLHEMGWAHSVETWLDDRLVGGLYGVAIGGLFAGESMFHRSSDASKVALVHLVEVLSGSNALLDVQWVTPHVATLGAITVDRDSYLALLATAVTQPTPTAFGRDK